MNVQLKLGSDSFRVTQGNSVNTVLFDVNGKYLTFSPEDFIVLIDLLNSLKIQIKLTDDR